MVNETSPPLHPDLEPLAAFAGIWEGEGTGVYPTIEPFAYTETLTIGHVGKPFLTWAQRTRAADDGRPLHIETGYVRCHSDEAGLTRVELVVSHPTGHAEVAEGTLEHDRLEVEKTAGPVDDGVVVTSARTVERVSSLAVDLMSTSVAYSSSAKPVDSLERRLRLDGDSLTYVMLMGAVGLAHQAHLRAALSRVG